MLYIFRIKVKCCFWLSRIVTATMLNIFMTTDSYECTGSIVLLRYIATSGCLFSMLLDSKSSKE